MTQGSPAGRANPGLSDGTPLEFAKARALNGGVSKCGCGRGVRSFAQFMFVENSIKRRSCRRCEAKCSYIRTFRPQFENMGSFSEVFCCRNASISRCMSCSSPNTAMSVASARSGNSSNPNAVFGASCSRGTVFLVQRASNNSGFPTFKPTNTDSASVGKNDFGCHNRAITLIRVNRSPPLIPNA